MISRLFPVVALAACAPCGAALAARVYYVNQPENAPGFIHHVAPDGSGHATLFTAPVVTDLRGVAVDAAGQRLFFLYQRYEAINSSTGNRTEVALKQLPLTGGGTTDVLTFPDNGFLADVEWDGAAGWLYYAQTGENQLRRVRPDGSGDALVATHVPLAAGEEWQGPYFFCLDPDHDAAFWGILTVSGNTSTPYTRAALSDGEIDAAFSLTTPTRSRDVAIDPATQRLYWCDRQDGTVYSRLVSGGPVTNVRPYRTLNAPHGLALDLEAGKAYVADTGKRGSASEASSHRVVRFSLDGTGPVEFLSPVSAVAEPWDVALDLTSTSYADWKTRFFAATAVNTAPGDDADGDGVPNAAEHAFFRRPDKADTGSAHLRPDEGGVVFARRKTSDVPVRVELSTDLATWHWNGDGSGQTWTVETGTTPRDDDSEWVSVAAAPGAVTGGSVHFRLRVLVP